MNEIRIFRKTRMENSFLIRIFIKIYSFSLLFFQYTIKIIFIEVSICSYRFMYLSGIFFYLLDCTYYPFLNGSKYRKGFGNISRFCLLFFGVVIVSLSNSSIFCFMERNLSKQESLYEICLCQLQKGTDSCQYRRVCEHPRSTRVKSFDVMSCFFHLRG